MPCIFLIDANIFGRVFSRTAVIRSTLLNLILISIILCGNRSSCRLEDFTSDSSSRYVNLNSSVDLKRESLAVSFKSLFTSVDSIHTTPIASKLIIIPTASKSLDTKTDENERLTNLKESTLFLDLPKLVETDTSSCDKESTLSSDEKLASDDNTIVTSTVQESAQPVVESITPSSSHEESSESVAETLSSVAAINDTLPQTKDPANLTAEPENKVTTPDNEAMPSFDEWKKKKQAELTDGEKPSQGTPPSNGVVSGGGPTNGIPVNPVVPQNKKVVVSQKRRRNYASYECGAKVLASNRETEGAGRILNEQMDEYMLNPCKAKVWFIIELCDTVQASQIELANFELFSSLPKDFTVSASDQYPTRDWIPLGTFQAQDQRILHSFPLLQQGYGKFLKVELLSHYGKEHYCPLSVVRVFGTSMVDEFEDLEATGHAPSPTADEDDRPVIPSTTPTDAPNDIFGNAKKVVMTFISKAAQALGRESVAVPSGGEVAPDSNLSLHSTQKTELFPEHRLQAEDISKQCANHTMNKLQNLLVFCGFCVSTAPVVQTSKCRFLWAVFNGTGIHSLCLKSDCQSEVRGRTNNTVTPEKLPEKLSPGPKSQGTTVDASESTKFTSSGYTGTVSLDSSRESVENVVSTANISASSLHIKTDTLPSAAVTNVETSTITFEDIDMPLQPSIIEPSLVSTETVVTAPVEVFPDSTVPIDMSEDMVTDSPIIAEDESRSGTRTEQIGVPISSTQKESVFVRLNNRIRLLEVNLSLSSQYLQELSQRYRRQMEDMQRAFNRTVGALNQTALRAAERDQQQQASLAALQKQMEHITGMVEKLRLQNKTLYREVLETHLFIIAVEAIVVVTILTLCWRRYRLHNLNSSGIDQSLPNFNEEQPPSLGSIRTPMKRHHSVCDLLMTFNGPKKRRPSESVSTAGTYSDLMIVEPAIPIYIEQPHKARKRHRNRKNRGNLLRSASNPNLSSISESTNGKKPSDQPSPISNPAAGVLFFPSNPDGNENCENCIPSRTEGAACQPKVPFQNLTNPKVRKEDAGACKEHFSLRKLLKMNGKKGTV